MALKTDKETSLVADDPLDLSSLVDALEDSTDQLLGQFADAPAVQKLISLAPNVSISQLRIVRAICANNPDAGQNILVLEQELRDLKAAPKSYVSVTALNLRELQQSITEPR
jgi:hypothetical protein